RRRDDRARRLRRQHVRARGRARDQGLLGPRAGPRLLRGPRGRGARSRREARQEGGRAVSDRDGELFVARVPWGIVLTTLAICGIGIMNLASAAQAPMPNTYLKQLAYFTVGCLIMF